VKISIITICFNSEKTISRTIESVISQDYQNVEYIVIDGNSSDETIDIIKSFGDSIDVLQSESDTGIYDAFNKGLKLATGDVIGFLNSDDYFVSSQILSDISREFSRDSNLDILLSGVRFISSQSFNITRTFSAVGFQSWKMYLGLMPPHPGSFISQNVYKKVGNFDESFLIAGDFEFFVRVFMKNNFNYKIINKFTVAMALGGASTSGFKSYSVITDELSRSLAQNGLMGSRLLLSCRGLFKLRQLFKKFQLKRNMQIS
tara:strand:- start:614 stop:1393 length:780 start_codon:yes stop_codon:yes gene_type:complete